MVQEIDLALKIWDNIVPFLKGKNTRNKTIPVAGYMVQFTEELVLLHNDIYLTDDMLFDKSPPLFIILIRKNFFKLSTISSTERWIPDSNTSKKYTFII